MKELIGVALLIIGTFAGTKALPSIARDIERAALTKAAQGLPPMAGFTRHLTAKQKQ